MTLGAVLRMLAAGGLLALVLAWFAGAFHPRVESGAVDLRSALGASVTVTLTPVPEIARAAGTVRPTDETVVGSRVLSTVIEVKVRAGATVARGDLLVALDDAAARATLEQRRQAALGADAALDEARLIRDRSAELFGRGSLSRAELDTALTSYRRAEAEQERAAQAVREAETILDFTMIRAPIDGRIVERLAEPGDVVAPGQPLLTLFNPGRLRIEAEVRESLVARVSPGDVLGARIDAVDADVAATVEEIVPTADPGSRSFLVKALLPELADVYPGMFARLEVPIGNRARLLVPNGALQRSGQLSFVNVRTGDGVERRLVRSGERYGETIEIISGLEPGETVVLPSGGASEPIPG